MLNILSLNVDGHLEPGHSIGDVKVEAHHLVVVQAFARETHSSPITNGSRVCSPHFLNQEQ